MQGLEVDEVEGVQREQVGQHLHRLQAEEGGRVRGMRGREAGTRHEASVMQMKGGRGGGAVR